MKSIKVFLVTCIATFTLCAIFMPVSAKPMMETPQNIQLVGELKLTSLSELQNDLPSTIILGSAIQLQDDFNAQPIVINEHKSFFEAALLFNDKLHQFLAWFNSEEVDANTNTEQNPLAQKVAKKTCKSKRS